MVPMGIAPGLYMSSRGGISVSSGPRGENPGGGSGHLLSTRASSTGDTALSSINMGGGLGAGALVVLLWALVKGPFPKEWEPQGPS